MAMLLARQMAAEMLLDLVREDVLLPVVHFIDRIQQQRLDADLPGQVGQGPHILGEAASAIADAGKEKRETDAAVVADAAADVVDVAAHLLAQIGHLVDEADLRREQRVGDVLRQLGAFGRHDEQRLIGPQERAIQLAERVFGLLGPHADDHAVGILKIVDRGPFLEKLGIAGDVAVRPVSSLSAGIDLRVRADGDRALDDDDRIVGQVRARSFDAHPDILQVGRAFVRGRPRTSACRRR